MTPGLQLVRIHRDIEDAPVWLHAVCDRVRTMSARFGSDLDGEMDVTTILGAYASRDPRIGAWALVRDGSLVGHLFVRTRDWDGETLGWVHQFEHGGHASQDEWDMGMAAIRDWATALNAAYERAGQPQRVRRLVASTPHDPKFFERRGGFRPWRTLVIREV